MNNSLTNNTPDTSPAMEQMKRMMFVAQMRAKADDLGAGFIGGYMDPETGEVFMQTNIDQEVAEELLPELLPGTAKLNNN